MRTARSSSYLTETPWIETPIQRHPEQRPPQTEFPLAREPPGQRSPWTETTLQTETPGTETLCTKIPTPRQRPRRRNIGPGSQTGSDIIQRPPWYRMTHASENIILPQTLS